MGRASPPPPAAIEVVVLHTRPVLCEALRLMLERQGDVKVVLAVPDLEALEKQAAPEEPIVIMELALPVQRTLKLLERLRTWRKRLRVLVWGELTDKVAGDTLAAGVAGVLHLDADEEELQRAVRAANAGGVLDNSWLRRQLGGGRAVPPPDAAAIHLCPREKEVLRMKAANPALTHQKIADKLDLSKRTVDGYFEQINAKLGTKRSTRAVERAREQGLLNG